MNKGVKNNEVEEVSNSIWSSNGKHRVVSRLCLRVSRLGRGKLSFLGAVLDTLIGLVTAGFFAAFMGLIILHPWLLLAYLIAINQIGNIIFNYLLLTLFVLDLIGSSIAGIIMEGKREGAF